MLSLWPLSLYWTGSLWAIACGQLSASYPHHYPGRPDGSFSAEWQNYFEVTEPLPNVTFALGRSWAGNIPVGRPDHTNNTLFFWAFEKEYGSLTTIQSEEPWGIWLNGGPGSSSLFGLLFENGPLHIHSNLSLYTNEHSWHKLSDYFWIDQPVGVGWSTNDVNGYVADEDEMARDFFGFLANLVRVFPSLKSRPLHLTGESYAGTYIPYIMKEYFNLAEPPVRIAKIAMGDALIGSEVVTTFLPALSVIETYPQVIGYDTEVYEYFKEQSHLCGYDLNLTYPQNGHFPSILPPLPSALPRASQSVVQRKRSRIWLPLTSDALALPEELAKRVKVSPELPHQVIQDTHKRSLLDSADGTINPTYGCNLFDEMIDFALNYSVPWRGHAHSGFNRYDVPDALYPGIRKDATAFLNDNRTRSAIHAPMSKDWVTTFPYPFRNIPNGDDPSVEPMAFLSDLATNLTKHNIGVAIYVGNNDAVVPHLSSEIVIQNTTFGGIQGFTRRPSTPWYADDGSFAGIIHQERGWLYALFQDSGHYVPRQQPERAYAFARDFIFGNKSTGQVGTDSGELATVVGGGSPALAKPILLGQPKIYVGSSATQSTYIYPAATVAAWNGYFSSVTAAAFTPSIPRTQFAFLDCRSSSGYEPWTTQPRPLQHVLPFELVLF